ncbi:cell cycle transcriptional regulator TrcR [Wolbachia endosymbiont of Pentidionis agamae]|uniref:cell cycle transcriptional regulator TrcR n=1 Tax=Wolbachia endosymbiont of Pentidionis agamae TaxID=3110435 RepID=UPI002FD3CA03
MKKDISYNSSELGIFLKCNDSNTNKAFLEIASWFIDNTSLTFEQIAKCCKLNYNDIKSIADGEIEVTACNPITMGRITKEEILDCEKKHNKIPQLETRKSNIPVPKRRDKPDAVYWILKNYPAMGDAIIAKLIGTTTNTVEQIRNGTHHNINNIRPRDPVLLYLCRQEDLEQEILKMQIALEKIARLKNIEDK